MKKSEILFWLFFFGLNFLLFFPRYIMEIDSTSFIPTGILWVRNWSDGFDFFFKRQNSDIFRISLDFTYALAILIILRRHLNITLTTVLITLFYLLLLFNQIYISAFERIYQVTPLFFNDLTSLKTTIDILFERITIRLVLLILAIGIVLTCIFWVLHKFLQNIKIVQFGTSSLIIAFVLMFFLIFSQIRYGFDYDRTLAFPNIMASITGNIKESLAYKRKSAQINVNNIIQSNDIQPVALQQKPNIYLLFIESYGRYVYDNPDIIEDYKKSLINNEKDLLQHGWHSYSALSTPPVSGGISWVSYSSVLYGINMENQGMYDFFLLNDSLSSFVSLTRFFRQSGYKNYRLNTMYPHQNMVIPWTQYSRFYAIDKWITFEDLEFNGKMYGFGPSPPDQYSVNYAVEEIIAADSVPYTLFYLTQNSHWPFYAPDSVATNWKNLNTGSRKEKPNSQFIYNAEREDYILSITYQLNYITDLITRSSGNNLFLIIGDHQPPIITTHDDKFETPVHIISKDTTFISGFSNYGMNPGLLVDTLQPTIRHEGIYSMFMREFLRNFANVDTLPKYRPKGINIYE